MSRGHASSPTTFNNVVTINRRMIGTLHQHAELEVGDPVVFNRHVLRPFNENRSTSRIVVSNFQAADLDLPRVLDMESGIDVPETLGRCCRCRIRSRPPPPRRS